MRAGDGDWGRQAVDTRVFVIYSQHFHIPFDCPESSRVDMKKVQKMRDLEGPTSFRHLCSTL